ncbi:HK97 family phage prohead protease [Mycobacterium kansasii]
MSDRIFNRFAQVDDVDLDEGIITVVVVPYEEPATVEVRGQLWQEVFERGAFTGIDKMSRRVPVNLEHNKSPDFYVGMARKFFPENPAGLVAELEIFGDTDRGRDTLKKAVRGGLSASVGFVVRHGDFHADPQTRARRIRRAFVDHVALVAQPAYEGARVLQVRNEDVPDIETPTLDEIINDPILQYAAERAERNWDLTR